MMAVSNETRRKELRFDTVHLRSLENRLVSKDTPRRQIVVLIFVRFMGSFAGAVLVDRCCEGVL